jgi:hypothetical protein
VAYSDEASEKEYQMATIHCSATTTLSRERVLAALTDFSPRRPQLWPNLDERFYELHDQGEGWAEVTEGSKFAGGIWERCRYDWHSPGRVRIEVLASNAFMSGGSWTYSVHAADGKTKVELEVVRRGRTLKGRMLAGILRLSGRLVFCGDLQKTLNGLVEA